jgi:hypothetical protein
MDGTLAIRSRPIQSRCPIPSSPLLQSRIVFLSSTDWQKELMEIIPISNLPKRYGGSMEDSLLRDPQPVPQHLHWTPKEHFPAIKDMLSISVPAG